MYMKRKTINDFKPEQIWEAITLFRGDVEKFELHCMIEYEWAEYKCMSEIIQTLSDDAFKKEVEFVFSQEDIKDMELWLNEEYEQD